MQIRLATLNSMRMVVCPPLWPCNELATSPGCYPDFFPRQLQHSSSPEGSIIGNHMGCRVPQKYLCEHFKSNYQHKIYTSQCEIVRQLQNMSIKDIQPLLFTAFAKLEMQIQPLEKIANFTLSLEFMPCICRQDHLAADTWHKFLCNIPPTLTPVLAKAVGSCWQHLWAATL